MKITFPDPKTAPSRSRLCNALRFPRQPLTTAREIRTSGLVSFRRRLLASPGRILKHPRAVDFELGDPHQACQSPFTPGLLLLKTYHTRMFCLKRPLLAFLTGVRFPEGCSP